MMIPPKIHQIWLQGKKNVPPKLQVYSTKWKDFNPDFEYVLWDDEKIINEILPSFPERYGKIYATYPHLIQRADFGRYLILFLFGGIYVDMDMRPVQPLRELYLRLRNCEIIFGKTNNRVLDRLVFRAFGSSPDGANNAVIMCKPHSRIMESIITECSLMSNSVWKNVNKQLYIQKSTGPGLIGKVIERPDIKPAITLLDSRYFESCGLVDTLKAKCSLDAVTDAIAVHDYNLSWFDGNVFILKIYAHSTELLILAVCVTLLVIAQKRA